MLTLYLALLLAIQGISVPNQGATITGVLRDSAGKPAPGVRVGAIAVPDSTLDVASASAMVSLAQTDAMGRYRLENVPPGRYYVAAGRVDFPTYYPGTQALARGTVISITSSAPVDGIDFTLQDSSSFASNLTPNLPLTFSLPVQVAVEGGARLPVFSPNGFVFIGLTNATSGVRTDVPVNASTIALPSQTVEYRVTMENMPAGYRVKSIMAGSTDVRSGGLRLSTVTFKPSIQTNTTRMVATTSLAITLTAPAAAPSATSGVRVAGQAKTTDRRSIYISGQPGTFFSDGTFEFNGVPAGRHSIASIENPESTTLLGASLVVGDRDVQGVELDAIRILPMDIRSSVQPRDAGSHPTGSIVPLASLQITLVDEQSRQPAGPGTIYVLGPLGTSFDLPTDGRLEFPRLLPGKYSFEIRVFRHSSVTRTIAVDDQDIALELSVASDD